jgi:hypothetical protein
VVRLSPSVGIDVGHAAHLTEEARFTGYVALHNPLSGMAAPLKRTA